ncbi:hypothetical protein OEZ86_008105 [Tetradesmus obliquus]|nr:hypothetical protein OEZ86_008105 [Tetradesmus obliquus]
MSAKKAWIKLLVVLPFLFAACSANRQLAASGSSSSGSSDTDGDAGSSSSSSSGSSSSGGSGSSYDSSGGSSTWLLLHEGTRAYVTPAGRALLSASVRRQLLQDGERPTACGKLGTLVANYYTAQGSMYGIAMSSNSDGSLILVGAPMNVPNVTIPGGANLLTSQNSKTCEYTVRPVWRPRNSYKYYGAQVALSEDGSTMLVMDGVEAVMVKQNSTGNGTTNSSSAAVMVPAGNKPVVHVFRKSRMPFVKPPSPPPAPPGPWDPECCQNVTSQCCVDAAKKFGNWPPGSSDKKKGHNGVMDINDMPFMGIPGTPSWEQMWTNRTGNSSSSSSGSSSAGQTHGKHDKGKDDKKGKHDEPVAPGLPTGKPYRRLLGLLPDEEFRYVQKLDCELRQAMAASMSVSVSKDGDTVLVSFAIGEGFPDKRGSAQVFYWDKDTQRYKFIQDLETLNQPAGVSVHFGASSAISTDGQIIAVGSAAFANQLNKFTYLYRRDSAIDRFRIIAAINNGETYADPWPTASAIGVNIDNALAMSQSGRYILRVEDNRLVVYEGAGSGMSMSWARRCQIAAPQGYLFRTSAGALSIVEVAGSKVKFAAGAYMGDLQYNPQQMAVFMFYMDARRDGTCPWRPAEKHTHADPFSQYGAAVTLTPDGKLMAVGAPEAWDNNMSNQTGAVYLIDASEVEDTGLRARTVTIAANDKAGCVNGRDANGNACVQKAPDLKICKDIQRKDGSILHIGPPGCKPPPPPSGGWFSAASLGGPQDAGIPDQFRTSSVSAYTTLSPSIKGGVAVPVGQNIWLGNQAKAATQASYFGVPTAAITKPKDSIVSASGWPTSVSAALGGLPKPEAAPPAIKATGLLQGLGNAIVKGLVGAGAGGGVGGLGGPAPAGLPGLPGKSAASIGLPAGAVIRNPEVLKQGG